MKKQCALDRPYPALIQKTACGSCMNQAAIEPSAGLKSNSCKHRKHFSATSFYLRTRPLTRNFLQTTLQLLKHLTMKFIWWREKSIILKLPLHWTLPLQRNYWILHNTRLDESLAIGM